MALRALLFSSDGTSTSTLCQILTDLGIEAEICSEMLMAVQRVAQENYDAILVDWDQEADAISLLKTVREQKMASQALNLALVQNDKDLPRALQHGANSAIKKPIDLRLATDTLSTARDLILSRRSEQKTKEERVAAAQAAVATAAAEYRDDDDIPAPKTGFLAQNAPRSGLEAEESTEKQDGVAEQPYWKGTRGPASLREQEARSQEIPPVEKEAWNAKPQPQEIRSPEEIARDAHRSQDSTGVFSSLPELQQQEEAQPEPDKDAQPRYLLFALIACLLIAAVMWMVTRGDSGVRLWTRVVHLNGDATATPAPTGRPAPLENPVAPATSTKIEDPIPPDPDPIESSETDVSKVQIIETKAVPRPGAQQPASTEAAPDSEAGQSPSGEAVPTDASAQTVQPPPPVQPVVIPVARPQAPVHENPRAGSDGRAGVIIPDSLKTAPSQSPASSLDSGVVPEDISRGLVERRVEPDYPAQALSQRLEGPVVLQVWVAKDGTVKDVKLVKGYFAFGRAAFDAIRQWHFKPYSPNGRPIDFQTVVTLNFKYPG